MSSAPMLLVVDDDPAVLASLTFSLELEGFEVAAFDSGETLLEQPNLTKPACLVIDYRLPGSMDWRFFARCASVAKPVQQWLSRATQRAPFASVPPMLAPY